MNLVRLRYLEKAIFNGIYLAYFVVFGLATVSVLICNGFPISMVYLLAATIGFLGIVGLQIFIKLLLNTWDK